MRFGAKPLNADIALYNIGTLAIARSLLPIAIGRSGGQVAEHQQAAGHVL